MCVYPSSSLTAVDAAKMAIRVLTPGGFLRGNIPAFRVWHSSISLLRFSWVKALWCFYCIKLVSLPPPPQVFPFALYTKRKQRKKKLTFFIIVVSSWMDLLINLHSGFASMWGCFNLSTGICQPGFWM